jgi:hypothetical protein
VHRIEMSFNWLMPEPTWRFVKNQESGAVQPMSAKEQK